MSRVKMVVARERRLRVLGMLYELGADGKAVELSITQIAKKANLTYDQARGIMRALVRDGLVQAFRRSLPNGGTDSNAYCITPAGREYIQGAKATEEKGELLWRG